HRYQVVVDPARTIVGGSSLGGLASAYVALERPDLFGAVLAQSGSFWWKPSGDDEFEWLARRVAALPLQAVRFYLEVGKLESAAGTPAGSHSPAQILSNRNCVPCCGREATRCNTRSSTAATNGSAGAVRWQRD
ncbi:MAG TPA: alpha/beta hydrolase-fold protein, partial [Chloroflexota bacterium]|nr:alpha/beta hydrolase-fold protein [Chloroflexota bacterium]